jgi:hypothetical protein
MTIPAVRKARATTAPSRALLARDFMGFSGLAARFDRNWSSAAVWLCDTGACGRFGFPMGFAALEKREDTTVNHKIAARNG